MPTIDGFYSFSDEVSLYTDGFDTYANTPDAFHMSGSGTFFNVTNVAPTEPFLISVSPDPATYGQILTLTGVVFNKVVSVIVDGLGREFTYVNSTTITVSMPLMTVGVKSVHVEYI